MQKLVQPDLGALADPEAPLNPAHPADRRIHAGLANLGLEERVLAAELMIETRRWRSASFVLAPIEPSDPVFQDALRLRVEVALADSSEDLEALLPEHAEHLGNAP